MNKVTRDLIEYMRELEIIDCHEHLCVEPERIAREVDVLTLLSTYASVDMASAGLALSSTRQVWVALSSDGYRAEGALRN